MKIINKKTATIYCRVSTKKQANCPSLEIQYDICKCFCKANNIQIVEYIEEVSSAWNVKNLYQLRKLVKNINTTYLMVSDFSRFGRDLAGSLDMLKKLKEKNVIVFSVVNNVGYTDFYQDRFKVHELLNQAQQESDKISFKIRKSLDWKKKNGIFIGKNPPFGFSIYFVNGLKKLRVNREEEKILNEIIQLRKEHNNYISIATILNEKNIKYRNIDFTGNIIGNIIRQYNKKIKNDVFFITNYMYNINVE
jgi:DNA invertase Pin-like site-specific DNA recombinase